MLGQNNVRSRNRKRSENARQRTYSKKYLETIKLQMKKSLKLESNDRLLSMISNKLMMNTDRSNKSISENVSEQKIINSNNSNNTNTNKTDNKTLSSKEKENNSSKENASSKKATAISNPFESCNLKMSTDVKYIFNGKPIKKREEELYLDHQYNTIEFFIKSIADKNKKFKQLHENIESNISSSNLGFFNNTKTSSKSEEKNTKINLQNILESDVRIIKRGHPCIILSDKINIENSENKLDLLIKIMEDYREIIMERIFSKNFQDRIILSIFVSLSQTSFKLYNCVENIKKFNNLRKYICGLSDNIKYNLFNNPNFTMTSINQKFIDIFEIKEENQKENSSNNDQDKKSYSSKKIGDRDNSSLNFSSNNKNCSSTSNCNNKNNSKDKYKYFCDDEDEEIIYENFEDFNEDNGDDKDYIFSNNLFEMEQGKDNNYFANNINYKRHASNNADILNSPKMEKTKLRRNAAHKIAFDKSNNRNSTSYYNNLNTTVNEKQKEYDFQIINVNDKNCIEDIDNGSDDSMDSDEEIYEIHENHKFDIPKLVFFEDHVKDKEKRKINKNNHLEIWADSEYVKDKVRIKELSNIGFANIINIINKDSKLLPNHELNLNPFEIKNFIKQKEKKQMEKNIVNKLVNIDIIKNNNDENKDNKNKVDNKIPKNNNESFWSNLDSKSNSFFNDEENNKNKNNILNDDDDEEEEDDED